MSEAQKALLEKIRVYFGVRDAEDGGSDWWLHQDAEDTAEYAWQADSTFDEEGVEIILAAIELAKTFQED